MQGSARQWMMGLVLMVLLLAPAWGGALVANAGFVAYQRHDWRGAAQAWAAAAAAPGGGDWARLGAMAAGRAGELDGAARLAAQAVRDAPGAPLPLWQQGLVQHAQGQPAAALESWRQAGAAPYFCTQASQVLYQATPPDPVRAVEAATVCTALEPAAGAGWLVLGQAEAALGHSQAALAALGQAYGLLLAAGQPGRAAVAAATAAGIAGGAGGDPATAATWRQRALALAPAVCADPARPRDPNLDALCAQP